MVIEAAPSSKVGGRLGPVGLVLLAGAMLSLGGFADSASAAQAVGGGGAVYACYKVKGKRAGSVKLVPKRKRCRHGERKVHWSLRGASGTAGPAGAAGPGGTAGAVGPAGASGPVGPSGSDAAGVAALETRVTQLTARVEALEGTLNGVSNESLTSSIAAVSGISHGELEEAVGSVADVSALCTQAGTLTTQVNGVGSSLENTALGGIIPIGLELLIPGLPGELPAFTCP